MPPPQSVEHRQAIIVASYGLAIDQARCSLERERGARDQGEAAGPVVPIAGEKPHARRVAPPKPKWTRRRTYQRIRNEIQALEAKAKTQRFKKPLNPQLFAYYVS